MDIVAGPAPIVPLSREIAALQNALQGGNAAALEAFWREVAKRGTPLIEPIAGDGERALVTFIWRATEDLASVIVGSPLVPPRGQGILLHLANMPNTDVWYGSVPADRTARTFYYFWPIPAHLAARVHTNDDELRERVPDPFNPRTLVYARHRPDRTDLVLSVVELPGAVPDLWTRPRVGVAAGGLEEHRFASQLLGNERTVWIYRPPGYAANGRAYPLLLFFDGGAYVQTVPTPTILENLLSEAAIPPLVAAFIGNANRRRELGGDPQFVDALADELVPWVQARCSVTSDARRTIVGGHSGGGFTAAFAALRRPDRFGNILSISGSFYWIPGVENSQREDKGDEWLAQQYRLTPVSPARFFLAAGRLEHHRQFLSNRRMRDALRQLGYTVHYMEFTGGHDCLYHPNMLAEGLTILTCDSN